MISASRRVVITGIGLISPLGDSKESLWDSLSSARSAVGPLTSLSQAAFPMTFAAEARGFEGSANDFGPLEKEQTKAIRKSLKVMCRECQMGVAAAQLALNDSRLREANLSPDCIGISFGSDSMLSLPDEFTASILQCLDEHGNFVFSRWATQGMPKMSPLWLLKYLPNMPASHFAIYNDFRGPNNSITLREAAANVVLAESYQIIVRGRANAMIVGATGTRLHPLKTVHAIQQEELAVGNCDPTQASRPFDRNRFGMVLGEGAGAMVLEDLETAQARGATIFAEVVGGASSSVVDTKFVAKRGQAMRNALAATLAQTHSSPDDVAFLHAHGLSTRSCDKEEAWAIHQIFGDRKSPIPVVAMKSYCGNLGAGGGMIEAAAGVLAMHHGRLFPSLNYDTPDPECPVAMVTEKDVPAGDSFINLNVTPQGQASAAMFRRFTE
jgi:3-oxoacyl-[acyl-carrier-protein] synthase II